MFRILEDRIMGICDENIIKTTYCYQYKYDSYKPSYNEDWGCHSLVETSYDAKMMKPHVLEFGYDTEVDDMVYNNWSIYHRNLASDVDLVVWQTFRTRDDLMNNVNQ